MKKDILPLGVRVLLVPAGLLLALILIFMVAVKVGSAQVLSRRANLALLRKNEEILTAKRDLLSNIAPEIASQTNLVTAALPGKVSTLLVISQIRNLASANGVILTNVKVSAGGETKLKVAGADIGFNLVGPVASVLNLISGIKKIAPITHISKVDLTLIGADVTSTVLVRAYWAPFPTKLPALTEPVAGLNKADEDLLKILADLTLPAFVNLVPNSPVENPNPFGE